ncbi:hypothetical protein BJV78DRAFT_248715 [Lactifluus subvellereus]|nr:hypothetical protein BJV78DRAFT_248715 [Lactifluus subvellereus]
MAHYDIFRNQLAIKYPAYGHALWEPSPGRLYSAVEVGDVGFIREGKFHRLFNALLPAEHLSHQNLRVPEYHEPLRPTITEHIYSGTLASHDFYSGGVTKTAAGLEISASGPTTPGQVSFTCTKKHGAVLSLPVQAQREDTLAKGDFRDHIIRHVDRWFAFTQQLGLGIDQMEDIILVTGRDRTRSCTNVAFTESQGQDDARVSFGVQVSDQNGIQWSFSREDVLGAVLNPGRSGQNLREDQCVFIRGWRVTRTLMVLRRLRGAAEHSPDSDGYGSESEMQAKFIPTVPKHNDPLHALLEHLAEQVPECDMVAVHDDDLIEFIEGIGGDTSTETLQAGVDFQSVKPEIKQIRRDSSSTNQIGSITETEVVCVAMLSNEHKERSESCILRTWHRTV